MKGPYPDGIAEIFHGNMAKFETLEDEMISDIIWVFDLPEKHFVDLVRFIEKKRVVH